MQALPHAAVVLTVPDRYRYVPARGKIPTVQEVFCVTRPDGELRLAAKGLPANRLMHGLHFGIQLFDGFETTRDNFAGKLESLFKHAGSVDVVATRAAFNALRGTLWLYEGCSRARSAGEP